MRLRLVMAMLSPSNSRDSNFGKWERNSRTVAVFIVIQNCVTKTPESRPLTDVGQEAAVVRMNAAYGDAGSASKLLEVEFGHADTLEPFADVEVACGVHGQAVGAVQAAGFQDGHWTDRPVE